MVIFILNKTNFSQLLLPFRTQFHTHKLQVMYILLVWPRFWVCNPGEKGQLLSNPSHVPWVTMPVKNQEISRHVSQGYERIRPFCLFTLSHLL